MRWGILPGLLTAMACSAPAPTPEPEPTPVARQNPPETQAPAEPRTDLSLAEQRTAALSQRHYELALAYFNKGDFDKAKVEAREAVRLKHDNLAARKLLGEIYEIIAGPGALRTGAEVELQHHIVAVEQAQIEIVKHLRDGERYYNARMYRLALKEFENAELKILAMPTDVASRADLLPQAKSHRLKAKHALQRRP